jgi:hypothetical protein
LPPPERSKVSSTVSVAPPRNGIAHHLFTENGERKLILAHLRYGDTFIKLDGAWLFAERNLYVDWIETKPSHP